MPITLLPIVSAIYIGSSLVGGFDELVSFLFYPVSGVSIRDGSLSKDFWIMRHRESPILIHIILRLTFRIDWCGGMGDIHVKMLAVKD